MVEALEARLVPSRVPLLADIPGPGTCALTAALVNAGNATTPGFTAINVAVPDIFLQGKYIEVGIHGAGSFGTESGAPAGFHPLLDDDGRQLGFVVDPGRDGWENGTPAQSGDYLVPGSPDEGWAIQWSSFRGEQTFANFGLEDNFDVQMVSHNHTNFGDALSAVWVGCATYTNSSNPGQGNGIGGDRITDGPSSPSFQEQIKITQTVHFNVNDQFFVIDVVLENVGGTALSSIKYLRNVNPDQEAPLTGEFSTRNFVQYQPDENSDRALVVAEGLKHGLTLGLGTVDARARVSTEGSTNRDPKEILDSPVTPTRDQPQVADEAIALAFDLGSLQPGEKTSFSFAYVLSPDDLERALNKVVDNNVAPSFGPFEDVTIQVGAPWVLPFTFTDPGADFWTAEVDYREGKGFEPLALVGKSGTLENTFDRDADYIVLVGINDGTVTAFRTVVVHAFGLDQLTRIGDIDTALVAPGETGTTVQAGDRAQGIEVKATLDLGQGIDTPISVLVATYRGNPVAPNENFFTLGDGQEVAALGFVDVRVTGLDEKAVRDLIDQGQNPSLTVDISFRVPSEQADLAQLFYFNGTEWVAAVNGPRDGLGVVIPAGRVVTDNGDGTSTATLTSTFNHQSNPRLWELGGTVFTVAVPTPPAALVQVTLLSAPLASLPTTGLTSVPPTFSTSVSTTTTVTLTVRVSTASDVAVSRTSTEASSTLGSAGVGGETTETPGSRRSDAPDQAITPAGIGPGGFMNFRWIRRLFRMVGTAGGEATGPAIRPAVKGIAFEEERSEEILAEGTDFLEETDFSPEVLDSVFAEPEISLDLEETPSLNGLGFAGLALVGGAWGLSRPERQEKRGNSLLGQRGA